MRVLYFTRDYTTHDYRFLKAICDNGDDVYLLLLEKGNVNKNRMPSDSIHTVDWKYGKESFDINVSGDEAVSSLKQVFEAIQPDVIHTGPLTDCSWLAAKAGLHPHVAMSWGFDLGREIELLPGARERASFALSKADWFLGDCYTELEKAAELGYDPARSLIFPWGIDAVRFSPGKAVLRDEISGESDFLILSLRTMEPIYDVETVVQAFLRAVKYESGMRLILLGDGSQMTRLQKIAEDDENGRKISFLGRQPNDLLVEYYRSCDLYVSASLVDGSSVSLIEAMGCGLPVLISDIPGNLEWVRHEENGLTFETGNIEDLSEKMQWCCRNSEKLKNLAAAARKVVEEKADWEKNKLKIKSAYRKACGL